MSNKFLPVKFTFAVSFLIVILSQGCKSKPEPLELSAIQWQFTGHLGQYIDKIAHNRILDRRQWDLIYPETEDAFKFREDDNAYPKFGAWRYEFWGKYMLSAIAAANYYQDEELKGRIADATNGLLRNMDENGYLGSYKRSDFLIGNNWNVWGRKYTLWGLIESYQLLGDENILQAASKFADHLMTEVGPEQVDIIKTGNFYGMPSTSILQPMVMLYRNTGNPKYLDYAEYIVAQWGKHPQGLPDILQKGLEGTPVHLWFEDHDPMDWAKGYEFTSCVEGMVELYKVTKNDKYLEAAKNIFDQLVKYERSPLGSVSFNDKYIGSAGLINTVAEICDAVYWNRLAYQLYEITDEVKYIEEMERTLYNSLLCAFNTEGTWGLRRLRTSHLHIPAQNHFLFHHQCCTDNLPRGLFQAAEFAVKSNHDTLQVNIFSPGKGKMRVNGIEATIVLQGDYLEQSKSYLSFELARPARFAVKIRMPQWSKTTTLAINGTDVASTKHGSWIIVQQEWQNGDQLEINFDMHLRWEKFDPNLFDQSFHNIAYYDEKWSSMKFMKSNYEPNNERYKHVDTLAVSSALAHKEAVTFFYGPLVLARDIRVSQQDIFTPVVNPEVYMPNLHALSGDETVWKRYAIDFGDGTREVFCDFSSAGNTWSADSEFNTWCILK